MLDNVDKVGLIIWEEYYRHLSRRIDRVPKRGGHDYWDDKRLSVFRSIAQRCIDENINPADFVVANFETLDRNVKYLLPEYFDHPAAITRAKQYGSGVPMDWFVHVGIFADTAARCIPKYFENENAILLNPETPFPAWFRISYITPCDEAVMEWYGSTAWTQLREDPKLRDIVRKHRPDNVKALEQQFGSFGDDINKGGGV